jgi:citrate synthase
MTSSQAWIGAAEAAERLGVSRATLYAYVSRGYLRSQATAGPSRERLYSHDDVERLRRRTEERRAPDKVAARALQWGMPILESSIALIDGRKLYYRGHDAAVLARTRSLEEVASLIWTGSFELPASATTRPSFQSFESRKRPFLARAHSMLASAAAQDPLAVDLRASAVAGAGYRIVRLLTAAATGRSPDTESVEDALARHWKVSAGGVGLLRAALIACADHELNVSSFTARCVASAGSHPYAVVSAGLAALEGPRHGGATARVEAMLESVRGVRALEDALAARLRRGESVDGFGHPLYRDGDPRARLLLELIAAGQYGRSAEGRFVAAVAKAAARVTGDLPNVDFGLAALGRTLRLPAGSPSSMRTGSSFAPAPGTSVFRRFSRSQLSLKAEVQKSDACAKIPLAV